MSSKIETRLRIPVSLLPYLNTLPANRRGSHIANGFLVTSAYDVRNIRLNIKRRISQGVDKDYLFQLKLLYKFLQTILYKTGSL